MRKTITIDLWENKFAKIVSQINAYEYNLLSKWCDDFLALSELIKEWNLTTADILEDDEEKSEKVIDITEDNLKKLDLTTFFILQRELTNTITRALDKKKLEKIISSGPQKNKLEEEVENDKVKKVKA